MPRPSVLERLLQDFLQSCGFDRVAGSVPVEEYLRARARADMDVQLRFSAELLLRNGVYRHTRPHRLDDLLPLLIVHARALQPRPLRVLDVACASGVSTVEMHLALTAAGIACETYGTDLLIAADYVQRDDGVGMLFGHNGQLLQIDIGQWATNWKLPRQPLALHPFLGMRARRLVRNEMGTFRSARHSVLPGYSVSEVPLVISLADSVPCLRFVEEDIGAPRVAGRFELIRAANILNVDYFGAPAIRGMARALCDRLTDGGFLLIARTVEPPAINRATLFRYNKGQLAVVEDINGGSEVTALVMSCLATSRSSSQPVDTKDSG